MKYNFLGKTGIKVSELCLGAMTFGRELNEQESYKILDNFSNAGGNFIDTADVYSMGKSEEIIGNWLRSKNRDDFVIATKVRFAMSDSPNDIGLSRKHILSSIDGSLNRLKTDHIDIYQIHSWDYCIDIEDVMNVLNYLVQIGKVRYLGASNLKAWQLQKAIDLCRSRNWETFSSLQPLYNLLERAIEFEILQVCENEKLGVIPWSPLRGGWLSGKFYRGMDKAPDNTRIKIAEEKGWSESWSAYNNERTWSIIDELIKIAKEINKTPAQVALNWLLQKPIVTSPIIGVRNLDQLKSNLDSTGWDLDQQIMDRLNKVSDLNFSFYPYSANYEGKYKRE